MAYHCIKRLLREIIQSQQQWLIMSGRPVFLSKSPTKQHLWNKQKGYVSNALFGLSFPRNMLRRNWGHVAGNLHDFQYLLCRWSWHAFPWNGTDQRWASWSCLVHLQDVNRSFLRSGGSSFIRSCNCAQKLVHCVWFGLPLYGFLETTRVHPTIKKKGCMYTITTFWVALAFWYASNRVWYSASARFWSLSARIRSDDMLLSTP